MISPYTTFDNSSSYTTSWDTTGRAGFFHADLERLDGVVMAERDMGDKVAAGAMPARL